MIFVDLLAVRSRQLLHNGIDVETSLWKVEGVLLVWGRLRAQDFKNCKNQLL